MWIPESLLDVGIVHTLNRSICSRSFGGLEFLISNFDHPAAIGSEYSWETNFRRHGSGINAIDIEEGSRDSS